MKKPFLSQTEAVGALKPGFIGSIRGRMRNTLGMLGFSALSSLAGCGISTDIDWQNYRDGRDAAVTPDSDAGIPEDSGVRDGDVVVDSGPAPCLPAGDMVVSADNIVNMGDMRNSVGIEIPFSGNCDALSGTMLSFELNDGLTSRQNRPVLQVDNTAHMVRARLDLSTIMSEASGVTVRTEMAGSSATGRFNVDFTAPTITSTSMGVLAVSGNYQFRAAFNSRGRLFVDFLRDSDELSYVAHGDTTTGCTTATEATACSMPAPDSSGRTQGCSANMRMMLTPVPTRVCDIREGRIFVYDSPGADTLFVGHDTDARTIRTAVGSGAYFKVRLLFVDDAGNSVTGVYRVMRQ